MSMKPTDAEIKDLLTKYKNVVVVGLSTKTDRPSFEIARYLADHDYEVVGVNPGVVQAAGVSVYASLGQVPVPLEIVDVFRSPEHIPALVESILALPPEKRPKVLWLQEGITHPDAEKQAAAAGITVVSDRCIMTERERLISTSFLKGEPAESHG
ncbi:MAG TPA: CoA-binding protein [Bdellovibrionales bacterium]|nr:CoA-binding protein [Bdellovibrionales bacterium]